MVISKIDHGTDKEIRWAIILTDSNELLLLLQLRIVKQDLIVGIIHCMCFVFNNFTSPIVFTKGEPNVIGFLVPVLVL